MNKKDKSLVDKVIKARMVKMDKEVSRNYCFIQLFFRMRQNPIYPFYNTNMLRDIETGNCISH